MNSKKIIYITISLAVLTFSLVFYNFIFPMLFKNNPNPNVKSLIISESLKNPKLAYDIFLQNKENLYKNVGTVSSWDELNLKYLEASLLIRQTDRDMIKRGLLIYRDMINDESNDRILRTKFAYEIDYVMHGRNDIQLRREVFQGKTLGKVKVTDSESRDMLDFSRVMHSVYPHSRFTYKLALMEAEKLSGMQPETVLFSEKIKEVKNLLSVANEDFKRLSTDKFERNSAYSSLISKSQAITYLQKYDKKYEGVKQDKILDDATIYADLHQDETVKGIILFYLTMTKAMNYGILQEKELALAELTKVFDPNSSISRFRGKKELLISFYMSPAGSWHHDSLEFLRSVSPEVNEILTR